MTTHKRQGLISLIFIILTTSGCAPVNPKLVKAKQEWDVCWKGVHQDPRLQNLFSKVSFDPDIEKPTFEMMANNSYPSDGEKKAIAIWGQKYDSCMPAYHKMEESKGLSDKVRTIETAAESQLRMLIAELYNGKITYGDFTKQQQKVYDGGYIDLSNTHSETECYKINNFTSCNTR